MKSTWASFDCESQMFRASRALWLKLRANDLI